MKIIIFTFTVFILLVFPTVLLAQGNGQQNRVQDPATHENGTPTAVANQNQVQTQNQGEDTQLQVETQEQENLGNGQGEGLQIRNQNAIQNMSEVAQKVQEMLQLGESGGIGDQVRQIAQEQNQTQTQTQEQLGKLESKGKLARFLTGTDFGAVKNLKQQLEQNQLKIQQLQQLQNQLSNQEDITLVQEMVQALIAENTSLQERITAEEQTKSIFGWLFQMFAK